MKRTLSYTITNKNKADTIGAFLRDAGYSRRILIELKQNPEQICLKRRDNRNVGLMPEEDYDVAGFAVGVVDKKT